MFFRGRQPEGSIWRRFRSGVDGFTYVHEDDYYAAHVVSTAERTTDLFYALSEHLPPAVDVHVDDLRAGTQYEGEHLALPDVRETLAKLKVPLSQAGGVEIAVFSAEDQLTINQHLELFIYARTDRWLYLLQGKGLQEVRAVRTKSWKLRRTDFQPAPDLEAALAAAIQRLGLRPVAGEPS
jgi:hypothetical protein